VAVRCPAGSGDYTPITPRQPLAATPYALYALNAATALSVPWSGITGIPGDLGDDTDTLGSLACSTKQIAQWNGSGWACSDLDARPAQILWVAKSGGDFSSIQAAIGSISNASATNPYLIRIAPGVYNETVVLQPHIHLEGSGEEVTILRRASGAATPAAAATLRSAAHSSVRALSIENQGSGAWTVALHLDAGANQLVEQVTSRAQGGTHNAALYAASASQGQVRLLQAAATAAGNNSNAYGIYLADAQIRLQATTARADAASGQSTAYGLYIEGGAPGIDGLAAEAHSSHVAHGIYFHSGSSHAIRHSSATVSAPTGYAITLNPGVQADLHDVTGRVDATAIAAGLNTGNGAQLTGRRLWLQVQAGSGTAYGILTLHSVVDLIDSVAYAASSGPTYGLSNSGSTFRGRGLTLTASSANGTGLLNQTASIGASTYSAAVRLQNSQISGSSHSIYNGNQNGTTTTVEIGGSMLEGNAENSGGTQLFCLHSYTGDYIVVTTDCVP
jgi:hypothetical protein